MWVLNNPTVDKVGKTCYNTHINNAIGDHMYGFSHRQTRPETNRLIDMLDEGILDARTVADMALAFMSEHEVKQMMQANDIPTTDQADEDEEEESDPMDDFNYVGSRHHY